MPLMISRIGQARGRPVLFAAGKWGSITRHSLSVTSVWYRFISRICCIRVVGVHMVSPGLVSATSWNHADPSHSTSFETASKLGGGVSLPSRVAIPKYRIRVALRHALALVVHDTKIVLGNGIAMFSEWPKQSFCNREVAVLVCCTTVIERSCGHWHSKAQH